MDYFLGCKFRNFIFFGSRISASTFFIGGGGGGGGESKYSILFF